MLGQMLYVFARLICVSSNPRDTPIDKLPQIGQTELSMIQQISVEQLKAKQISGQPFCFWDVRTREEWAETKIPGAILFLDISPEELALLDKNTDIVFQCRSGGRSQRMAEIFKERGFLNLSNLIGGILAWQKHS